MQGIAEVVPVSSSAQLTLLPWLLGWEPPVDRTTFAAGLHAGSCAGLVAALRHDLRGLDRRTAGWLALSTVPAGLAGLIGQDAVEARFGRPGPTAALLAGAGALMWAADRRPEVHGVGRREVAVASAAQVLALAPGVSRSGVTLTALRAVGVRRPEAQRWSLLMSLPVTAGAAWLTVARARQRPATVPVVLAGMAAVAGATAVQRASSRVVGVAAVYRLGVAAAVALRLRRETR